MNKLSRKSVFLTIICLSLISLLWLCGCAPENDEPSSPDTPSVDTPDTPDADTPDIPAPDTPDEPDTPTTPALPAIPTFEGRHPFAKYDLLGYGDFEYTPGRSWQHEFEAAEGSAKISSLQSGGHALSCPGSGKQYMSMPVSLGCGDYFVACRVRANVLAGAVGIVIDPIESSSFTYVLSQTAATDGDFVTLSGIYTAAKEGSYRVGAGLLSGAGAGCYIDDIVLVPLSSLDCATDLPTLTAIYGDFSADTRPRSYYVDLFMDYLNQKAASLGMTGTHISVPSGCGKTNLNYSTARDIMLLFLEALKVKPLTDAWSQKTAAITVNGSKELKLYTTVTHQIVEEKYPILGGKTGSWVKPIYNVAVVSEIDGKQVVAVILGADGKDQRYQALRELLDISAKKLSGENVEGSKVLGNYGAISCLVKPQGYEVLFEQNADEKGGTASVAKVISALCALEIIEDLNTEIFFEPIDIYTGSGDYFVPGDTLTFSDALLAMMLPSSNSTAQAVANTAGQILAKKR